MNVQNMMRRTQRLFMTRCPELNRESGVNPEQQPLLYRKKGRQKPLGRQPEKGARRGEGGPLYPKSGDLSYSFGTYAWADGVVLPCGREQFPIVTGEAFLLACFYILRSGRCPGGGFFYEKLEKLDEELLEK